MSRETCVHVVRPCIDVRPALSCLNETCALATTCESVGVLEAEMSMMGTVGTETQKYLYLNSSTYLDHFLLRDDFGQNVRRMPTRLRNFQMS